MRLAIITLAAAALSPPSLAAPPSPLSPPPPKGSGLAPGDCFRRLDIRNHTIADARTLLLDVSGRATYRVSMAGACLAGAIPSDPVIMREPPGASVICKPIDMDVRISKGGSETGCIIESISKMPPEEVAALPKRLKP